MDTMLTSLFSWQLLLFSLGIFFIVWFIRTCVEYCYKNVVNIQFWNEIILRFLPCVIGAIIAKFMINYPYPNGIVSVDARILFGLVSGGLSGTIYAACKGMVKGYIQGIAGTVTTTTTQSISTTSASNAGTELPQPPGE